MSNANGHLDAATADTLFRREYAVLRLAQKGEDAKRPNYQQLTGEYNRLLRQLVRSARGREELEDELAKLQHLRYLAVEQVQALQSEVEALKQKLEETVAEKNHFIGVASHDLRSPLSALYSMVQLLHSEGDGFDEEMRGDMLSMACDSLQRMMGLVDHLLDLNRLERGVHEVEIGSVDVAAVCQRLVSTLRPQAEAKGIKLHVTFPDELPEIQSAETSIDRILENFLSNAIKYSPLGSTVTFGATVAEKSLEIWVQDQGPGLTEEDRKKLFRPFQRLSAQPTGGESASGLGLAIAKKLAEEVGGEVTVFSEPGVGARFGLRLPLP